MFILLECYIRVFEKLYFILSICANDLHSSVYKYIYILQCTYC